MGTAAAVKPKKQENPFLEIVRDEPLVFKSKMSKERFHRFVLKHNELKIERDKFGIITIHPPMTLDSGYFEGEAFRLLANWSKSSKIGKAYSPTTSFDLPDGSEYKADGAWISLQKIALLSEEERKHIAAIVPDFVIETRSQSDSLTKLKKKMNDVWLANGVQLAWLIDPQTEKVWIYRQGAPVQELNGFHHVLSGENVLPGFELNLQELKS